MRRRSANKAARTRVSTAPVKTMVCAASTRSARGMVASPKCPTPKVMDPTTVEATMNAEAAANVGGQRTEIHSRTGNTIARGNAVDHGPSGSAMATALNAPNIDSPNMPSNSSARGGTWRTASAIPTSSGATAIMPSRQEPNQTLQNVTTGTVASKRATTIAAPVAATTEPMVLASKNPSTLETIPSLNDLLNHRSINAVVRSAWAALTSAKATASPTLLPIIRLETTVATTTPAATENRPLGPHTINAATEIPAAGQNTDVPVLARRARPSRAAMK